MSSCIRRSRHNHPRRHPHRRRPPPPPAPATATAAIGIPIADGDRCRLHDRLNVDRLNLDNRLNVDRLNSDRLHVSHSYSAATAALGEGSRTEDGSEYRNASYQDGAMERRDTPYSSTMCPNQETMRPCCERSARCDYQRPMPGPTPGPT